MRTADWIPDRTESAMGPAASDRTGWLRRFRCLDASVMAWFWDGVVLASLMAGGPYYDRRLFLTDAVSVNQVLWVAVVARLLWILARQPTGRLHAPATLGAVAVLAFFLVLRSFGIAHDSYTQYKVLSHVVFVLPTLMCLDHSLRTRRDFERILQLTVLAGVGMLLLCIPHLLTIHIGQRLAVLGGGPNVLARLVGSASLAALALFLILRSENTVRRVYLVCLPLCAVALILAGTKAVFFGLGSAVAFLSWRFGKRRIASLTLVGLMAIAVLPFVAHPIVQNQPLDGGVTRVLRLPDFDDPFGSYGARQHYIDSLWQLIRAGHWMGVGTGEWGTHFGRRPQEEYPHNMLFEIFTELGIVAVVALLLPFAAWPRLRMSLSAREHALHAGLLALVIFWLVNVLLSGDLVDSRYLWWYVLLLEASRRHLQRTDVAVSNTG